MPIYGSYVIGINWYFRADPIDLVYMCRDAIPENLQFFQPNRHLFWS